MRFWISVLFLALMAMASCLLRPARQSTERHLSLDDTLHKAQSAAEGK